MLAISRYTPTEAQNVTGNGQGFTATTLEGFLVDRHFLRCLSSSQNFVVFPFAALLFRSLKATGRAPPYDRAR